MLHCLSNDLLAIKVKDKGAELSSLLDLRTGREWLWQGDPQFWAKQSPVLFPFIGKIAMDGYRHKGVVFPMTKHGLARDLDFVCVSKNSCSIDLQLRATPATQQMYPFDFMLQIKYLLAGNRLTVSFQVTNLSSVAMHFNLGGHPAFNCPMEQEKWHIRGGALPRQASLLDKKTGLLSDANIALPVDDDSLRLREELFAADALIFPKLPKREVSLVLGEDEACLKFSFADFPVFALWSAPGPFVCLEPWLALPDKAESSGELCERQGFCCLAPGGQFAASFHISLD